MEVVKKYIKAALEGLAKSFPKVNMIYAYNNFAETHIVQLTPQKEYYSNDALDTAWIEIVKDFYTQFPLENISFVSDDAELISTAPEFEFNAKVEKHSWDLLLYEAYGQLQAYRPDFTLEFTIGIDQPMHCSINNDGIVTLENINMVSVNENQADYFYAMAA